MEAVILCGGKGIRMNKASIPKPLSDLNGKPIIWHIMNLMSRYGVRDFILPLGYKGEMIRDYFNKYYINRKDYKLSLGDNRVQFYDEFENNWNITFADTGLETQTGARIKMVEKYVTQEPFLVTYGDGVGDIRIDKLLEYHAKMDRMATVTGVDYKSNYGILTVKSGVATAFREKPVLNLIVNAGFFAFSKAVFQYLSDDPHCSLETTLLKKLTAIDELAVYKHDGYWIGIDTHKDLLSAQHNYHRLYPKEKDY